MTDIYQTRMVIGDGGLIFGNSLWGVGKVVFHSLLPAALAKLQLPYLLASFAVFVLLVLYVILYEKVWWKRVTLLAFALILLPFVSADYRLLHVFFPLFMFINSKERGNYATYYAVMFALLLIPKDYYHLHFHNLNEATIQIILNPLIMVSMSLTIILEGLSEINGRGMNSLRQVAGGVFQIRSADCPQSAARGKCGHAASWDNSRSA